MPEAERILQAYGNHPSFVMMALGNECGGSREVMAGMVRDLRRKDPRRLPRPELEAWARPARFPKYASTTAETFTAEVDLADYSDAALDHVQVEWSRRDAQGHSLAGGELAPAAVPAPGVHPVGDFSTPLAEVSCPVRLDLRLSLKGTEVETHYPLWVYPARQAVAAAPEGVTVVRKLGAPERALLAQDRRPH
jgi:hypothetical protein